MPDVVVSEFMDENALDGLKAKYDLLYAPDLVDDRPKLLQELVSAKALIVRNRTQVNAELLAAGPGLTCIGRLGVGLDNIDVAACQSKGISVFPATGANNLSVAEYVITAALMLVRGAYLSQSAMIAGEWPRQALMGQEIGGKTIGLIGYGGIAREVASRAMALGMHVIAYDPFVEGDEMRPLDILLAEADVISLHVPLIDATRHMINTKTLAKMKRGAVVINAARGGVIDDAALAVDLRSGHLGGAALDVFETEPMTAATGAMFAGLKNVVLTPHIAGVTDQSNERVSEMIAALVLAHLDQ